LGVGAGPGGGDSEDASEAAKAERAETKSGVRDRQRAPLPLPHLDPVARIAELAVEAEGVGVAHLRALAALLQQPDLGRVAQRGRVWGGRCRCERAGLGKLGGSDPHLHAIAFFLASSQSPTTNPPPTQPPTHRPAPTLPTDRLIRLRFSSLSSPVSPESSWISAYVRLSTLLNRQRITAWRVGCVWGVGVVKGGCRV